jgi:carbonic anhydrase
MLSKEELEANNRRFSAAFTGGQLGTTPARKLVVLTCMDARIDPLRMLGLRDGDAHVLRNAGGRASDDAIRSIVISQQLLGTRHVVVIHHTGCGLFNVTNDELRQSFSGALGTRVTGMDFLPLGPDVTASVCEDVRSLSQQPLLASDTKVHGYVYDVVTGRITAVDSGGQSCMGGSR